MRNAQKRAANDDPFAGETPPQPSLSAGFDIAVKMAPRGLKDARFPQKPTQVLHYVPILAPLMNLLGIIRTQHGFNSGRRRRQHSRKRRRARLRTTAEWSNLREIKNAVRQPCSDDVLKTTITQRRPARLTPPPRTRSKCALQRSRASPPKAFLHRSSWDSDIARDNSTDSRHRESQRSAE